MLEKERIRILIADDHGLVREGIRAYLATQPDMEVVAEARDGAEAVKMASEYVPDVVLMDLVMPKMDGVAATRQVRGITPHTRVIVLTSYSEDEMVFPAIKAGALSYLLKDVGPGELAEAIRRAARGEATLHPRIAARLIHEVAENRVSPSKSGMREGAELSQRELDVLRLIATGKSNREIADLLSISEQTVKTHVSNILSKLHLADRTQAAIYALKQRLVPLE